MIFGPTPLADAEGALLAHSVRAGKVSFKKGRRLSADDLAALGAAGIDSVIAARLEADDVHEDPAAEELAAAVRGSGATTTAAFTGRCNLVAETRGLAVIDRARIDAFNLVDEAITIATLPPFAPVEPRQMLATVKVIPFAAPRQALRRCLEIVGDRPLVEVAPYRPCRTGLVQTSLPGMKASLLDKTREALDGRLAALGCAPARERRCPHDAEAVAAALRALCDEGCELLLVSGASAIVDRRDVVPAAVVAAGGAIDHFGMPVDPGNLLLLGHLGDLPVLGLPGCARSPKVNGFDWVLERLVAGLAVTPSDVMQMGTGGLLKEIGSRPLPRAEAVESDRGLARAPRIGALVLAAGQSRRMGSVNKLLLEVDGETMVRRAVATACASQADTVVVVTGHEHASVEAALAGLDVRLVHTPDYAQGLSTSLHRGLAALPERIDGAVVLLGDMPRVSARVVDRLIAAFDPLEGRAICLPTWTGKRGNPVLFAKRFFAEVQEISGDVGAKPLLGAYPEVVAEVPMDDDAVLLDVDTPDALARIGGAG